MEEKKLNINDGKLDALAQALDKQLRRQQEIKTKIEERWLEDLRQYHGKYSQSVQEILRQQEDLTGSSSIFVNLTRPKCNTAVNRFADILFPTEDRNWMIKPTPDPELGEFANDEELGEAANMEMQQAKDAAEAMQREIDDQLKEAKYNAICRDAIEDAVKLGSGILEGPVIVGRTRKAWQPVAEGVHELTVIQDSRPAVERVSPFDFFPDMSARNVAEAEFFYKRTYLTRKKLAQLAKQPGYLRDQIKKVLMEADAHNSEFSSSDDINQRLREISGIYDGSLKNRFEVWKFTGTLEREVMVDAGLMPGKADDPFAMMEVEIYFCNQHIIKAVQLPLDTDERAYSVFNWIKADGSIFGYGVSYVMRAGQEITNKSWRERLDNGALSVGPQTVVNTKIVEPADGVWQMTPRKTWFLTDPTQSVNNAFGVFDISSVQPELQSIFEQGLQLIDIETGIPTTLPNSVAGTPAQTATQAVLEINAVIVASFKGAMINWDDDVTVPLIGRFYDWNMQYNPDPAIKGDYQVDARGASALLVKESQVASLQALLPLANDPTFGPMTKTAALYRKMVEAQRINPDDIVKTDDEIAALQQADQPPSIDEQKLAQEKEIEMLRLQQERELKMLEMQLKYEIDKERMEAELMKVGAQEQTKMAEQDLKLVTGSGI